ncbi:integral membrane [Pyrenophora seminiperda CCB06]|uniref:Integral membrane n=1 Tax=Pyrenophora seminiperda CCB06 TaxID=1302712 RepID=A0A3M7LY29_9PLEO|nr:integral membrane [Pyrenophora seminiperda CCB06]
MILTRIISLVLRTAQWVFAVIVLGLTAYFIHQNQDEKGPRRWRWDDMDEPMGRLIFAIVWSGLSIIFAIVWSIPTTTSITGFVSDLVFTGGWAAVFGLLVMYYNDTACGDEWNWGRISFSRDDTCGQWQAAQAFSFLSMVVWLATAVLGAFTTMRLRRRARTAAVKNTNV